MPDPSPEFRERAAAALRACVDLVAAGEHVIRNARGSDPAPSALRGGDEAFVRVLDSMRDLCRPVEDPWSFAVVTSTMPILSTWSNARKFRGEDPGQRASLLEVIASARARAGLVLEAWERNDVPELRRWYWMMPRPEPRPEVA